MTTTGSNIVQDIKTWVRLDRGYRTLMSALAEQGTQGYLVGGAVRARLMGDRLRPRDVDIAVGAGVADLLRGLSGMYPVVFRAADAGTVQLPGGSTADLFSPQSFRPACRSVEEMLCWFDLSVNAIGVPLGKDEGGALDPLGGMEHATAGVVSLVDQRWVSAGGREAVHLMMRLAELAARLPSLRVLDPRPLAERLPELLKVDDWRPVYECHRMTRVSAVATLDGLIQSSRAQAPHRWEDGRPEALQFA